MNTVLKLFNDNVKIMRMRNFKGPSNFDGLNLPWPTASLWHCLFTSVELAIDRVFKNTFLLFIWHVYILMQLYVYMFLQIFIYNHNV